MIRLINLRMVFLPVATAVSWESTFRRCALGSLGMLRIAAWRGRIAPSWDVEHAEGARARSS
ncbi:MAG: hypothetical protein D6795_12455 [Deltaproteobacteria bacterium]|nr:MAG: hypothetical protein D6795_12455 [Deltaproteobacteria bacterium]